MSARLHPRRPGGEAHRTPSALTRLLRRYDAPVRDLAVRLRRVVLGEMAPCHELIYDAGYTVALWYSFSGRLMDGVCYIAAYRNHVNLGFPRGSVLADPDRLLKGTGKWMRHISMQTRADVDRPEVRRCIRSAMAEAADTPVPGEERPALRGVLTTVKAWSKVRSRARGTPSDRSPPRSPRARSGGGLR